MKMRFTNWFVFTGSQTPSKYHIRHYTERVFSSSIFCKHPGNEVLTLWVWVNVDGSIYFLIRITNGSEIGKFSTLILLSDTTLYNLTHIIRGFLCHTKLQVHVKLIIWAVVIL